MFLKFYLALVLFGEEEVVGHVVRADHLAEVLLAVRLQSGQLGKKHDSMKRPGKTSNFDGLTW